VYGLCAEAGDTRTDEDCTVLMSVRCPLPIGDREVRVSNAVAKALGALESTQGIAIWISYKDEIVGSIELYHVRLSSFPLSLFFMVLL
jgi:hypothetical protein